MVEQPDPKLIDGRYAKVMKLGQGGFGTAYLVTDVKTQKRFALKFLTGGGSTAFERFQREARILAAHKDHLHVVQLHDVNFENPPPYIVMEYCEGGSLLSWVKELRPWRDVAAALAHVLLGLNGVHSAGGFHRDIKPDNLLVSVHPTIPGRLVIKVGDWGIARVAETDGPMTRHHGGTPNYIAPEIEAGAPFDARADIFSLGVVAAELLTGERSAAKLGDADVPAELRSIVCQMLSHDPDERPSAQTIAQTLELLLATAETSTAQEPQADEEFGPWLFAALIFVAVMAALAALAAGEDAQTPKAQAPDPEAKPNEEVSTA